MKKSRSHIAVAASAVALLGGSAVLFASDLQAGSTRDTAVVSVTVREAAGVGIATTTTTTTPSTTTGTAIRAIPISTTSNVGFGDQAPADGADEEGAGSAAGSGSSGTAPATLDQDTRALAARGAEPVSFGGTSAVAVSGAPNQTFSVVLPRATTFSDGGNIVNLSGFQHSAGTTPALGGNGSGTFRIGAKVGTVSPAAGGSGTGATPQSGDAQQSGDAGGGQRQVLAAAFTQSSPFVNIVVTYN